MSFNERVYYVGDEGDTNHLEGIQNVQTNVGTPGQPELTRKTNTILYYSRTFSTPCLFYAVCVTSKLSQEKKNTLVIF